MIDKCLRRLVVFQSVSRVWLDSSPWAVARQAFLSSTISWSLLKLTSIKSMMHPTISFSVVPFSSCIQCFPASGSFLMSWLLASGGQSIGASASASVLPTNIQSWFPLGSAGRGWAGMGVGQCSKGKKLTHRTLVGSACPGADSMDLPFWAPNQAQAPTPFRVCRNVSLCQGMGQPLERSRGTRDPGWARREYMS